MAMRLPRRTVIQGIGAAAAAGVTGPVLGRLAHAQDSFAGETLHIQYWAGPEGQTIRTGAVDPFIARSGAEVIVTEGHTTLSLSKMRAEKANPATTVYLLDEVGVITAEREGLLETLDFDQLPNAEDLHPKFVIGDKGVGFFTYTTALIYNTELVSEPPTSWRALWDERYRGKIAVPPAGHGSSYQLAVIAALLNGGDQYNMEPAWPALEALRPNVAYMETNTAILAELLRDGEVELVMRLPYYFKEYIDKDYPIGIATALEEGIFAFTACAAITKDHPDKSEVAHSFVNELLSVDAQTRMAEVLWFGPTNRNVVIPPEISSNLVHSEAQWESIIPIDLDNLAEHREEWIQKYTRALG